MELANTPRPPRKISLDLYRSLVLIRRSEQAIIKHYASDQMKTPMHMSMGQEAIAVGVCAALASEDPVWASYRTHAVFLAKTGDTDRFFAELYGRETGTVAGKAGSMHIAAPEKGHIASSAVVASTIGPAVGMAFANKRLSNGRMCCVFFGDGAVDEGAFWESLNVACAMQLPVIFVCEDNGLAVHTPAHMRQGYRSIADVVAPFRCNLFTSDSTNVEAIRQLTLDAIASVRQNGQPAFLHLRCYRYLEHVGVNEDFNAGYRTRKEYEQWLARDCVATQRARLLDNGVSEREIRELELEVDRQVDQSVASAANASLPDVTQLYTGVFHEAD